MADEVSFLWPLPLPWPQVPGECHSCSAETAGCLLQITNSSLTSTPSISIASQQNSLKELHELTTSIVHSFPFGVFLNHSPLHTKTAFSRISGELHVTKFNGDLWTVFITPRNTGVHVLLLGHFSSSFWDSFVLGSQQEPSGSSTASSSSPQSINVRKSHGRGFRLPCPRSFLG